MSPFVYPEQWKLLSNLSSCHHFQLLIHLVLATLGSSLFKNVLLLSGLYACAHTISSLTPTQAPLLDTLHYLRGEEISNPTCCVETDFPDQSSIPPVFM